MDRTLELGHKPIRRLLAEYSVPAVIASIVTSLYNIVDSIFIGRGVGPLAITGLAITFPLMNLLIAFVTLVAIGGATVTSIFLGRKDNARASNVLGNVLVLCLIHALFFGGISFIFLDEILRLFGASNDTLPYAREFMEIILLGTPIGFVFFGLNNMMRASGYPKKAMISAFISVGVNVICCPVLIFVFNLGIRGAALSTIAGQAVGCIWVVAHFCSRKSFIRFSRSVKYFQPALIKKIYTIGLAPFIVNVCACIVVMFINKDLITYGGAEGDMAVGAYGIVNRVAMLFVMVVIGITQGMQPILGYNYGAGKSDRVKRCLHLGVIVATIIMGAGFIVGEFFPTQVAGCFTSDPILIEHSRIGFRLVMACFPLIGSCIVVQNYFQSIGRPKLSIFLSTTRQLLFLLPLLWILPRFWGVMGVWVSMTISDFISFVVTIALYKYTEHHARKTTA